MADAIQALGFEQVRKLELRVNGVPLVDTNRHSTYSQERREEYFIMTHSSTKAKKDLLERIAKQLGKSLRVEIV